MVKKKPNKVNIFMSVDQPSINTYFNAHDPAPLYKRQINHQFEQYILKSAAGIKRYDVVLYKMKCATSLDKQYAEPLIYAIKRHFLILQQQCAEDFSKYKRRSFTLLALSFIVVIFCHGALPYLIHPNNAVETILLTSFDVFSWVIFWRPIDKLVFDWNPHLKEISLMGKLATAEMIVVTETKESVNRAKPVLFAVSQTG